MTISVITICYNNLNDLINTCHSVDVQIKLPFEHIIIDGSNNNNDIEKWHHSTLQPSYRTFLHEKDEGISDAFNKGIKLATGKIIVLLNSGDCFYDNEVTSHVLNVFDTDTAIKWIHAKYTFIRGNQRVLLGKPFDKKLVYRGMRAICHQTMFVKKELYEKYGLYDTELKLAMDFDFLVRIRNEHFAFIDKIFVQFAPDGASAQSVLKGLNENSLTIKKNFGFCLPHYIWKLRIIILSKLLSTRFGKLLYKIKVSLGLENM